MLVDWQLSQPQQSKFHFFTKNKTKKNKQSTFCKYKLFVPKKSKRLVGNPYLPLLSVSFRRLRLTFLSSTKVLFL
jgi:hypothetical protein